MNEFIDAALFGVVLLIIIMFTIFLIWHISYSYYRFQNAKFLCEHPALFLKLEKLKED